jgi:hypothetical protein
VRQSGLLARCGGKGETRTKRLEVEFCELVLGDALKGRSRLLLLLLLGLGVLDEGWVTEGNRDKLAPFVDNHSLVVHLGMVHLGLTDLARGKLLVPMVVRRLIRNMGRRRWMVLGGMGGKRRWMRGMRRRTLVIG